MAYKGKFQVINKKKYAGDYNDVIYRSLWEKQYMTHLDKSDRVIKWKSEPFPIQYFSEVHHKYKRYYPDFWIKVKTDDGVKEILVEIKPEKECFPPKKPNDKRKQKRYLRAVSIFVTNQCKWKAARKLCEKRKMIFKVITERHLGIVKEKSKK
jgi:hypothetical protein|tara:strand:+ start:507 stop:965 length:459 start_codon:yes stop_codon:yes gene_type:complete